MVKGGDGIAAASTVPSAGDITASAVADAERVRATYALTKGMTCRNFMCMRLCR